MFRTSMLGTEYISVYWKNVCSMLLTIALNSNISVIESGIRHLLPVPTWTISLMSLNFGVPFYNVGIKN